jgi:hypothetical protein
MQYSVYFWTNHENVQALFYVIKLLSLHLYACTKAKVTLGHGKNRKLTYKAS